MDNLTTQNSAAGLDRPAGAPTGASPSEPVIHVIPEKFYGAGLRMKAPPPRKEPPKPAVPPGPPVPPGAVPPPKPKNKLVPVLMIVIILLLLGGGGAAAYFFVFAKKPAPPAATNQNVNARPQPVCGDNKCDASESTQTCPSDCGQPGPVCGDNKCESPESYQTCKADCPAPAPVCGDNKCEVPEEDFKNCPADCQPPEPKPGLDSDSDGVTDYEEENIYRTNSYDPDSDHDSFVDLNEVLNLFNPAQPRPSMLKDNPGIALFQSSELAFDIFYPARWTRKDAEQGLVFTAPTGEFIQVLIESNKDGLGLMDWYLQQSPSVRSSDVQMFKTAGGYDEILSPDRLTAFVASGHRVFVISYNLGSALDIQYKATFSMMINSLKVTGDPAVPEKEEPPAETPPVEEPPAETPPVEEPPAETPPVEEPPVEEPAPEPPPVEEPPVETPPAP